MISFDWKEKSKAVAVVPPEAIINLLKPEQRLQIIQNVSTKIKIFFFLKQSSGKVDPVPWFCTAATAASQSMPTHTYVVSLCSYEMMLPYFLLGCLRTEWRNYVELQDGRWAKVDHTCQTFVFGIQEEDDRSRVLIVLNKKRVLLFHLWLFNLYYTVTGFLDFLSYYTLVHCVLVSCKYLFSWPTLQIVGRLYLRYR